MGACVRACVRACSVLVCVRACVSVCMSHKSTNFDHSNETTKIRVYSCIGCRKNNIYRCYTAEILCVCVCAEQLPSSGNKEFISISFPSSPPRPPPAPRQSFTPTLTRDNDLQYLRNRPGRHVSRTLYQHTEMSRNNSKKEEL